MTDKLGIAVTLIIAALVAYVMMTTAAKMDDPEYMCQSALGDEWGPAENVTAPVEGWVCEHPNGTVETVKFQNVTLKQASAEST